MKNFVKYFRRLVFGSMYPATRTYKKEYHEHLIQKMYAANKKVEPYLKEHHHLKWSRSEFSEEIKCDHITNNVAEV